MTELATNQRWLLDAQKKLAAAEAAIKNISPEKNTVVVGREPGGEFGVDGTSPETPIVSGRQPDGSFVRPNARVVGERPVGRVGGERPVGRVGGSRTSEPAEVDEKTRKAIMERNTAYVAKQAATARVKQDSTFTDRLADEIAKQMMEKYGTPYDAAITTARRLAEEEAEKKYNKKSGGGSGGSSALSEWDKEQNRKRKLFEGRGI
jgi:ribosomal protein S7